MISVNELLDEDDYSDEGGDEFGGKHGYIPNSDIISSGEHLWIDGIHISPFECPSCLEDDEVINNESIDCFLCEFFSPDNCVFLYDESLRDEIKVYSIFIVNTIRINTRNMLRIEKA